MTVVALAIGVRCSPDSRGRIWAPAIPARVRRRLVAIVLSTTLGVGVGTSSEARCLPSSGP